MVKNLPAMQETRVQSMGQEDPLEKGIAIHSCILAWRIPGSEEPGGLQSMGSQRVGHDWATNTQRALSRAPCAIQLVLISYLFIHSINSDGVYQMVLMVKNPPANAENWKETSVWSLGQEDPLEDDMATHSSILAWRIPWTEEPGGLQSIALQRVKHN